MKRRARIGIGIAAVVVAGAALGSWLWPWYAMPASPEHVQAQWQVVERLAARTTAAEGPSGIRPALDALSVDDDLQRSLQVKGPDYPELALEALASGPQSAIAALERWHREGAVLGDDPCQSVCDRDGSPCLSLNLLYLGRLALATSHGPEPGPRVEHTLHLAQVLRTSTSLVESVIGFGLASEAVKWAKARGVTSKDLFKRYSPTEAEVLPALARESFCSVRFAEATLRSTPAWPLGFSPWPSRITDVRRPPFGVVRIDRELAVAKLWTAQRLSAAAQHPGDLGAQADALEQNEGTDRLDRTALARVLALPYAERVRRVAEQIDAYRAWIVAGASP